MSDELSDSDTAGTPNDAPAAGDAEQEPHDRWEDESEESGDWLFDQLALQRFVLLCCQDSDGGLRDKPGKYPDPYHTCYCLSGMAIAQHNHGAHTCRNSMSLLVRIL